MKTPRVLACLLSLSVLLLTSNAKADEIKKLSSQEMERLVREITVAQNKATTHGATLDDVERLYAMYTADFVYEHPGMGDSYTRERLHSNHVRALNEGRYDKYDSAEYGYHVVNVVYGENAAAVLRTRAKLGDAPPRMAVFEFDNGKVARIREYWSY